MEEAAKRPCVRGPGRREERMTSPTQEPLGARRVVMFGSYAPSLINFRGPLIASIAARGHKVYALAPDIDPATARALEALGATPVPVTLGRTSLNPLQALATGRRLRALFRELKPDVVIAYTIKPIVLGAAAARAAGVKRFVPMVTGLGYAFLGGANVKRRLTRFAAVLMYRRAFRAAHFAIFQNEDDRADFSRLGILPASLPTGLVAGSGIDLGHFPVRPVPKGARFLMIARLLRDKGVREYGEAAARLKREHPQARFLLAGWLDESPDTIAQAELDAMIAGGVEFLGRLDDVRPALAECSVYVLPSYREGTPRSVLEAMAVGRAILTTDAPGCRETVVEGKNGWLVPPRDADALEAGMRRFIDDPAAAAAMGAESRRIAEEKFDVEEVNRRILSYAGL